MDTHTDTQLGIYSQPCFNVNVKSHSLGMQNLHRETKRTATIHRGKQVEAVGHHPRIHPQTLRYTTRIPKGHPRWASAPSAASMPCHPLERGYLPGHLRAPVPRGTTPSRILLDETDMCGCTPKPFRRVTDLDLQSSLNTNLRRSFPFFWALPDIDFP
jgi:hypothetical protein